MGLNVYECVCMMHAALSLTWDDVCRLELPGRCIFSCTRASQGNSSWGSPQRCFLSLWRIGIPERDGATAGKKHWYWLILIFLTLVSLLISWSFICQMQEQSLPETSYRLAFLLFSSGTRSQYPCTFFWFIDLVSWQKALITSHQLPLQRWL